MATEDTKSSFSRSIKNLESATSFEFARLLLAFCAKCFNFDVSSTLVLWLCIRLTNNWWNSMKWLSIQRFTNELMGEMYRGFIRSRGRLRPIQKPPETTKKKLIPSIGMRFYVALVLAIISIAFYSKTSILRNVESGKNISNSIARTIRAQEMHNLYMLLV
jgi:hypothetical protein